MEQIGDTLSRAHPAWEAATLISNVNVGKERQGIQKGTVTDFPSFWRIEGEKG